MAEKASPRMTKPDKQAGHTPEQARRDPSPANQPSPSPLLLVDKPRLLRAFQERGWSFAQAAFGRDSDQTLDTLWKHPGYQQWVKVLEAKITQIKKEDPRAGVGMRYGHRLFDIAWLRSPHARFELTAIVNRYDRAPFAPEHCGEVRFLYRLSYRTEQQGMPVQSRLPMTLNLVFWQPKPKRGDCKTQWKKWLRAPAPESPTQLASLVSAVFDQKKPIIKSLEVNLQSVRWPSMMHPSLGGHAEYLLMQFSPTASGGFKAHALENQPKAKRWSRNEQRSFRAWLATPKALASLSEGTLLVPERYLATFATSVAPHGLARGMNRPFVPLMPESLYSDFPFAQVQGVSNLEELRRRLDTMSCTGCHQSRSLAGFHFLGHDSPQKRVDALAVPHSAHLLDELAIRSASLAQAINTGNAIRPRGNPQRSYRHAPGGWGDHCGLKGNHSDWTCQPGLSCVKTSDPYMGRCQSEGPAKVGESCEVGTIAPQRRASDERARQFQVRGCQKGVCERNSVGFPEGMCASPCEPQEPHKRCGAIALLTNFNQCLAKKLPFAQCIQANSRPAGLRHCDAAHPCRDDMICARVDSINEGTCIPPYFLFQLRVDGHPLARRG